MAINSFVVMVLAGGTLHAADDPNLVKIAAYIDSRRADTRLQIEKDIATTRKTFVKMQRSRKYKLAVKRRYLKQIKKHFVYLQKRHKATTKPNWIPDFDFQMPLLHAIGMIDGRRNSRVKITPVLLMGKQRFLGRAASEKARAAGPYFVFYTDTAKLLVGRPAVLKGAWYISQKTIITVPSSLSIGSRVSKGSKVSKVEVWMVKPFDPALLTKSKKTGPN